MPPPIHKRRAFEQLVDQLLENGYVPDAVFGRGGQVETIGEFLAGFVGCEARLPARSRAALAAAYAECFGRGPPASRFATYAAAARRLAEIRRGVSGLVS